MAKFTKALISCGLALGALGLAWSDSLLDPTRPPPAWIVAQPGMPGSVVAEPDSVSGLRVLVVGKSRKIAVVDGQALKYGDSHDGSKILAIKPDGVTMEGSDGSKALKITRGIEKTAAMPEVSQPASKKSNAVRESK